MAVIHIPHVVDGRRFTWEVNMTGQIAKVHVSQHMQVATCGCCHDGFVATCRWVDTSISRQLTQVPHGVHMAVQGC